MILKYALTFKRVIPSSIILKEKHFMSRFIPTSCLKCYKKREVEPLLTISANTELLQLFPRYMGKKSICFSTHSTRFPGDSLFQDAR